MLAMIRLAHWEFYRVGPYDPLTLCGAGILFLTIALMASWIPARRAASIDPMMALRCE
jgi:ABC-type lipoprotein release transport system permease subunit